MRTVPKIESNSRRIFTSDNTAEERREQEELKTQLMTASRYVERVFRDV